MNICPDCKYQNREGVVFCERCSFPLIETAPVFTTVIEDKIQKSVHFPGSIATSHREGEVTLLVMGYPMPLCLKFEDELILGRAGSGNSRLLAFVNLDDFHASEMGVSRRHAVLFWQTKELYIRDLNSTNHTCVNGMRVPEGRDFLLQNGDEISLGKLMMKVYF